MTYSKMTLQQTKDLLAEHGHTCTREDGTYKVRGAQSNDLAFESPDKRKVAKFAIELAELTPSSAPTSPEDELNRYMVFTTLEVAKTQEIWASSPEHAQWIAETLLNRSPALGVVQRHKTTSEVKEISQ